MVLELRANSQYSTVASDASGRGCNRRGTLRHGKSIAIADRRDTRIA
jgi:hypothetical protein